MDTESLNHLEERLKSKLKMYEPDPDYVSNLKHRLTTMPSIEMEYPKTRPEIYVAAVAVVSGLAIALLMARKLIQK
jgi:hypothetical protein